MANFSFERKNFNFWVDPELELFDKILDQCFPTFFGSRHPYLVLMVLAAPLAGVIGIKIKEL